MYVDPLGMRKLLNWIRRSYGDIPILITENGSCDEDDKKIDADRILFYQRYINEVLKGMVRSI